MQWLLIFVFLIFSFIYSSSETALFALPTYRRKDNPLVVRLMRNPRRIIITVIIANVFSNVAISSLSEGMIGKQLNIMLSTLIVTIFILIIGEYIPKRVAMAKQKTISRLFSPMVLVTEYIFYPLIILFKPLTKLKIYKKRFTLEDLRQIIYLGRKDGIISEQEYAMMNKLSHLNDIQVKEIMSPRINVFFAEQNDTVSGVLKKMEKWHKRVPVYAKTRDNITGILETKNLYMEDRKVKDFVSPSIFVSENLPVIQLLKIFQKTAHKMVVVINEYGGTSGVVDMEDIKKELIGEIDESVIEYKDKNTWVVPGSLGIDEIQRHIPIPRSSDYRTVSGFIYTLLERIPREGERFSYKDYEFTILDIKFNHIIKVMIKKK
ncbi:HlyC/CorC family transporter [candidate division WOR-3 bacterium]|nr:HlyC/CorC family transporter [candidate division WOR-3 bacterium]